LPGTPVVDNATPEERIDSAYDEITSELRSDLLQRIVATKPEFFERLIVDLMIAMGYGGSRREAGQRLGKSGDGGIDGLINEDILGLDSIYLQAKRYAPGNGVGVEKVRGVAGRTRCQQGCLCNDEPFCAWCQSLRRPHSSETRADRW
jgi:restriction system protein